MFDLVIDFLDFFGWGAGHGGGKIAKHLETITKAVKDLSLFIGFGSLSRVKLVVLDEHKPFVRFFKENLNLFSIFDFDPGVIWGRSRHRKSIVRDQKI